MHIFFTYLFIGQLYITLSIRICISSSWIVSICRLFWPDLSSFFGRVSLCYYCYRWSYLLSTRHKNFDTLILWSYHHSSFKYQKSHQSKTIAVNDFLYFVFFRARIVFIRFSSFFFSFHFLAFFSVNFDKIKICCWLECWL